MKTDFRHGDLRCVVPFSCRRTVCALPHTEVTALLSVGVRDASRLNLRSHEPIASQIGPGTAENGHTSPTSTTGGADGPRERC